MQEQQNCSHKTCHIHTEIISNVSSRISFKDTLREKASLNKTPVLTKSMNMDIWVVGTWNQLFITGSYTEPKFSKNKGVIGETAFFLCDRSILYSPFCLS